MKEEVFYKHGRKNAFHKDYTICRKVVAIPSDYMGEEPTSYELHIGVAVCSPKDMFVKKKGVELSYKRAIDNPILKIALKGEYSLHQFLTFAENFIPNDTVNNVLEVSAGVKTY